MEMQYQKNVTEGGHGLRSRNLGSSPAPQYNSFLFAPIYEEASGNQLSVLSALVRLNVDPWEQAGYLAAMPRADAARVVATTLNLVSGKTWGPEEAQVIATRLVRLLPQSNGAVAPATLEVTDARTQRTNYWLMWLCFAIAMSFFSSHQQAAKTDTGAPTSTSSVTSQSKNGGAIHPSSVRSDRPLKD